jgi:hypothetical protein
MVLLRCVCWNYSQAAAAVEMESTLGLYCSNFAVGTQKLTMHCSGNRNAALAMRRSFSLTRVDPGGSSFGTGTGAGMQHWDWVAATPATGMQQLWHWTQPGLVSMLTLPCAMQACLSVVPIDLVSWGCLLAGVGGGNRIAPGCCYLVPR